MNTSDRLTVDLPQKFTYIAMMIKAINFLFVISCRASILAIAALMFALSPASAASTAWQDIGGGSARLVAILDPATNHVAGAVEIKLQPGWKTYWKNPGSSGIPPEFDFAESRGFSAGEVKFPTPRLISAAGAVFAGYKDVVSFPFDGQLLSSTGGEIKLNLFIGVCEEICIPAQAKFELPLELLMTSDPEAMRVITSAKLSLPAMDSGQAEILNVSNGANHTLNIEVDLKGIIETPALFVEGPEDWYLTPAKLLSQTNKIATFALDLSEVPEDADPLTAPLRYTLVSGSTGYELKH